MQPLEPLPQPAALRNQRFLCDEGHWRTEERTAKNLVRQTGQRRPEVFPDFLFSSRETADSVMYQMSDARI